eukprot:TRINITY_DN5550_c0_g1_i1.p1 TRINITY_DN5550_c0_g1~~TRINITY_DN5550_c0_g1_i1.p1  ORF type:complete len:832 (+),score=166.51 TRINITY_DN5550_c0_g1_i1:338-2497(+)
MARPRASSRPQPSSRAAEKDGNAIAKFRSPFRGGNVGRACALAAASRCSAQCSDTILLGGEDATDDMARQQPHPPSFYCPISHQCMHDPVMSTDGHTYERRYIEQWLQHKDTSPVNGLKLTQKTVFPNHALRNAIEEYFEEVFEGKRKAIQQTTTALFHKHGKFSCNQEVVRTMDALLECSILVHADLSMEVVLKRIMNEAKALVGADVASVFLVDSERRELFSTVNSTDAELRIPFDSGVAGHVACSGDPLIIPDAYADARFNTKVDHQTGFTSRNILCVPIKARSVGIIGVAQLINKTAKGVFTSGVASEAPAFTMDDQHFLEVFAGQAASAIVSSGMFQHMPSLRRDVKSVGVRQPQAEHVVQDVAANTLQGSLDHAEQLKVKPLLEAAFESWEIDTLALDELTGGRVLSTLTFYLLEKHGLISHFGLDVTKLRHFLAAIEAGYPATNQYHNRAHAASVVHFVHALLHLGSIAGIAAGAAEKVQEGSRKECVLLASLLAAATHDFEHDGFTNDFHEKTLSKRALLHSKSANEQHHIAATFQTLLKPECNFLAKVPTETFLQLRSLMVDVVLATDMAQHNSLLGEFMELTQAASADAPCAQGNPANAVLVLKLVLKCADLGHLALGWGSHIRWVQRLQEEFYCQGDKEKENGMAASFLMDRSKPGVSESQMGFFNFVVLPLYRAFLKAFPSAAPMVEKVEANYLKWAALQDELESCV